MNRPPPVIRDEHGTEHAPVPEYAVLISDNPRHLTHELTAAARDGWSFIGAAAGITGPTGAHLWAIWIERPTYPNLKEPHRP